MRTLCVHSGSLLCFGMPADSPVEAAVCSNTEHVHAASVPATFSHVADVNSRSCNRQRFCLEPPNVLFLSACCACRHPCSSGSVQMLCCLLAVAATFSAALLLSPGHKSAVIRGRSSLLAEGAKFLAHLPRVAVMATMTSSRETTALGRQVARAAGL